MSTAEIPLFPLGTVLFPGGLLPLKIFEQRYMDMAKVCIRDDLPFGVCLIATGSEVGAPAEPHGTGTLARIRQWDMPSLGVLEVMTQGEARFRIKTRRVEGSGLQRAEVEVLADDESAEVPEKYAPLLKLLRAVVADAGEERIPPPHRFDDATWVSYRLCEVLPIPHLARLRLLEVEDSASRLEILYRFLEQRGAFK